MISLLPPVHLAAAMPSAVSSFPLGFFTLLSVFSLWLHARHSSGISDHVPVCVCVCTLVWG